jgi:hypothetical protein
MAWPGFDDIAPCVEGSEKEPFPDWFARVNGRIPNVPLCVAEQWIHRHWDGHSPYEWLPLGSLNFRRESWSIDDFLRVQAGDRWGPLGKWVHDDEQTRRLRALSWVWKDMHTWGTWPAPIIVLDNQNELVSPWDGPLTRWHLLEGHCRSETMHCLIAEGKALLSHAVWVVSL